MFYVATGQNTMDTRSETTRSDAQAQVVQNLLKRKEERKRLARLHLDRVETRKREGEKVQFILSAEIRAKAEKACPLIYGMPLVSYLRDVCRAIADTPEGYISKKERAARKEGYSFPNEEDRKTEEELRYVVEDISKHFPNGLTMEDLIEAYEVLPNNRSTTTLFGRIMKNLGYHKHRTYIPAMADSPARLGWIYRKKEEDSWLPPAA